MKYMVITSPHGKILEPLTHEEILPLPYVGNRPDGTILRYDELRKVYQVNYTGKWVDCGSIHNYKYAKTKPDEFDTRIAYE